MLSSTAVEDLLKALPILASGMLGFFGAIGSQALAHRYSKKREDEKLRRERIESLIEALYANRGYILSHAKKCAKDESISDFQMAPFEKAQMLQALYLPELHEQMQELALINTRLFDWLNQLSDSPKGSNTWLITNKEHLISELGAFYSATQSAIVVCRKLIK